MAQGCERGELDPALDPQAPRPSLQSCRAATPWRAADSARPFDQAISAAERLPFAQGIGAILPPVFADTAAEIDNGTHSGDGNPITSAASSTAHIVHTSEAHGVDAGIMRAVEGLARRAIGLGHGTDGLTRAAELLTRR